MVDGNGGVKARRWWARLGGFGSHTCRCIKDPIECIIKCSNNQSSKSLLFSMTVGRIVNLIADCDNFAFVDKRTDRIRLRITASTGDSQAMGYQQE